VTQFGGERSVYDDEGLDPGAFWSTTNLAEALPGVQTPLSWSLWRPVLEGSLRRGFAAVGALERARVGDPADPAMRIFGLFSGRAAGRIDFLGEMGDRLPGTSGAAIAEQFLGRLPDDFHSRGTLRRLPVIMARFPITFATSARRVHAVHAEATRRWQRAVRGTPELSLHEVRREWVAARIWFADTFAAHAAVNFARVQPAYDAVLRLAASAGHPELAGQVLAGQGTHAELVMVEDLWELSRDRLSVAGFVARHGYHGPLEGELASRVWREDDGPVRLLAQRYRSRADTDSPAEHARRLAECTEDAARALVAAVPAVRRPPARAVLAAADRLIGLRGVGKAAFLQAFDSCRILARRAGTLLAADGVLDDREDVFYLLDSELLADRPPPPGIVADRRAERTRLEGLRLPSSWRGRPEIHAQRTHAAQPACGPTGAPGSPALTGTGASPGVVEAPARVVLEVDFAEVEPGEVLVAPVTDPAWAPIMFVSSALVVDIGGLLSHAAVVARELGIPCVMGVGDGTTRIRTGDLLRVDGTAGTVEVLRHAPS